ncbi:hypothetical protein HH308_19595 [Gordonia sp. TBRC 11910]|uniref:DNA-binding PucR family transcriptional regulator n=1 Tax=Gordonia asplenii TaxID=2725283 RepID=A0A848L4A6_9ACTN|nr:helix-turn-helix domain-containing protein [Gordonia asplenii]NMO03423.1 hypothetical protein [Gordonia asplenii]
MEQSDAVRAVLAAAAGALVEPIDRIVIEMTELLLDEIPALPGDAEMVASLRSSVRSNVHTGTILLRGDIGLADVVIPDGAREYARALAQRGASVTALTRAYRLGQQMFIDRTIDALARQTTRPALLTAATHLLIELNFGYIDRISESVIDVYQAEREVWLSHRRTERAAVLERLLGAHAPDLAMAEATIGYRLRRRHLGLVAWTDETRAESSRLAELEAVVATLADTANAIDEPLVWLRDTSTLWAWLPVPSDTTIAFGRFDDALAELAEGIHVALGVPASGPAGFRDSHRDAVRAARVASTGEPKPRLTSYADTGVRTAALLAADLDEARRLVVSTLGDLAVDDPATAVLRDTLAVYYEENGSHLAAAARLHVHKNTVKYRITKAAELRGRPADVDRLDAQLALIATRFLGSAVLR